MGVTTVRIVAADDRDRVQARRWAAAFLPSDVAVYEVDSDDSRGQDGPAEWEIFSGPLSAAQTRLVEGCGGMVVSIPREWTPAAGPIVAATGHDLAWDAAIAPAIELALNGRRAVVLAHVWAMPSLGVVELPPDPWGIGSIPDGQSAALSALATRLHAIAPDVPITTVARQGAHVARELVALSDGADGIAVGRPRPHGGRSPLGNVAHDLLDLSRCPVVIAPHGALKGDFRP